MRYNDQTGYLTAGKIVNEWPEEKIEEILKNYGEEKFSKKIAKNIVEKRKSGRIKTTFQLIDVVGESVPTALSTSRRSVPAILARGVRARPTLPPFRVLRLLPRLTSSFMTSALTRRPASAGFRSAASAALRRTREVTGSRAGWSA